MIAGEVSEIPVGRNIEDVDLCVREITQLRSTTMKNKHLAIVYNV